jgi:TRAP-type mannitol/chloroaromatic compound transport system permease large subunit
MGEVFAVSMVIAVCALLLAGYPVALTLAGISLLFAVSGSAAGMMNLASSAS